MRFWSGRPLKERSSSLNQGKVDSPGPSSVECPSPSTMSHQQLRHVVFALILGLTPLLPPTLAQAASSSPLIANASMGNLDATRIAQIRDSGPPVMRQAADYVATATSAPFTAKPEQSTATQATVTNPPLYREV